MCECCIFISIPEAYLEKEKSIQLILFRGFITVFVKTTLLGR